MEDNLWWKTTFGGRQPSVEDNLWWKTTIRGRQPLVEDDLRWKATLGGRRSLVEGDLRWKTKNINDDQKIKMNPLLAHTPHHTQLCGIFFIILCYSVQNKIRQFDNQKYYVFIYFALFQIFYSIE